ncbi:hypothetical protein Cgig2_018783 [Carnegiea gigantea]|uniref:Uncharacterized protein n=1 Tax=Carnegiea gigantea TaxID=171969 RepID=A0A9Q1K8H3_9CARY|nr:hypothetical protein Cgig2_018783 [Carnegiea gigantea]
MSTTLHKSYGDWFSETLRRETGLTQPRRFSRRVSASEGIVQHIDLYGKLFGHEGCVNAVEFNSTGDLLASGSDDRQVIFWNWATKSKILSYDSGHLGNIFQTKVMPFTDDQTIVTSAADGQPSTSIIHHHLTCNHTTTNRHPPALHRHTLLELLVETGVALFVVRRKVLDTAEEVLVHGEAKEKLTDLVFTTLVDVTEATIEATKVNSFTPEAEVQETC